MRPIKSRLQPGETGSVIEREVRWKVAQVPGTSIFLRVHKLCNHKLNRALRHNLREITSEHHADRHGIELERSSSNVVLRGASTAEPVIEKYRCIVSEQGVKDRKNGVDIIEAIVSVPAGFVPVKEYFEDSVRFLERYWECPIISAVVHFDQSNPHVHILVAPFRNGRRIGSKLVGYKGTNEARMRAFHGQVGQKYGLVLHAHYTSRERQELTIQICNAIAEDPQRLFHGHLARPVQEAIATNVQRIAPFLLRGA